MSQRSEGNLPPMDDLSALMDGELGASEVARACARWRDDSDARETWHTYQLIGDVLRSDDLAAPAARDLDFLAALRTKLAEEPVVLAPRPATEVAEPHPLPAVANAQAGGHAVWRNWRTPAAVMAGFAVVASVLVVTRLPAGADAGGTLMAGARSTPPSITLAASPGASNVPGFDLPSDSPQIVLDGKLIRDARLDEYLAAHKKFGGSSGPGAPSGFLRNAAAITNNTATAGR